MEGGTLVRGEEGMRLLVATLAEQNAQLERALESRVLIEQAKGMLAERWDTSPAEAFELLRSAARSHRRPRQGCWSFRGRCRQWT